MLPEQKQRIAHLIEQALAALGANAQVPVVLERPKVASHGDLACNVALQIAKPLKKNPREIAQSIADALKTNPAAAGLLDGIEVAGPGFINLRLAAPAKQAVVTSVLAQRDAFGASDAGARSTARCVGLLEKLRRRAIVPTPPVCRTDEPRCVMEPAAPCHPNQDQTPITRIDAEKRRNPRSSAKCA